MVHYMIEEQKIMQLIRKTRFNLSANSMLVQAAFNLFGAELRTLGKETGSSKV